MRVNRHTRAGLTLLCLACVSTTILCASAEDTASVAPASNLPRDPFWPVDYVPRQVKQAAREKHRAQQASAQAIALVQWPVLQLNGITKTGDRDIGLIHGVGLVEKGDTVRMTKDGVLYKWRILEVSAEGLAVRKLSATPIPLDSK